MHDDKHTKKRLCLSNKTLTTHEAPFILGTITDTSQNFSIRIASRLSGVSEHTIRAWERRYTALKPRRTPTGRRNYNLSDVDRLRVLYFLVEHGYCLNHFQRDQLKHHLP